MFGAIREVDVVKFSYVVLVLSSHSMNDKQVYTNCTGVMISSNVVLSSTRCATSSNGSQLQPWNVWVFYQLNSVLQARTRTTKLMVHPQFQTSQQGFDLALGIIPETLYKIYNNIGGGIDQMSRCYVISHGQFTTALNTMILAKASINVRTGKPACKGMGVVLCAYSSADASPCLGDQGAPLFCDRKLKGILSRGIDFDMYCGVKLGTMVFEDLALYRDFIWNNTGIEVEGYPVESSACSSHSVDFLVSFFMFTWNNLKRKL